MIGGLSLYPKGALMLYVIETDPHGAVLATIPCEDGIDEAINVIASRLTHPEEDPGVAADVIADRWAEATEHEDVHAPAGAERWFSMNRHGYTSRFGLAVIG